MGHYRSLWADLTSHLQFLWRHYGFGPLLRNMTKNLLLYLYPHPYLLGPVFISPLALSRNSPFQSHSLTPLSLPRDTDSLRQDLPLSLQDASAPPLRSIRTAPPPRSQPPTGTSQGSDPNSSPKVPILSAPFPQEPPGNRPPSPSPIICPLLSHL